MSKKYLLNELGIMLITNKHSLLLKQPALKKVRKLTIECIMTIEVFLVYLSSVCVSVVAVPRMEGGVLPIVACEGKLHPKPVPFSGLRFITE